MTHPAQLRWRRGLNSQRYRLEHEIIEAAKEWPANYEREELRTDKIALALFDATQALIDFETSQQQIKK